MGSLSFSSRRLTMSKAYDRKSDWTAEMQPGAYSLFTCGDCRDTILTRSPHNTAARPCQSYRPCECCGEDDVPGHLVTICVHAPPQVLGLDRPQEEPDFADPVYPKDWDDDEPILEGDPAYCPDINYAE